MVKLFVQKDINKVKFENVELKYMILLLLKNINLEASKGEIVALVGDSGGGKIIL